MANGAIPLRDLVHIEGDHYLAAGTARDWLALVAAVKARTGVQLRISPGSPNGAYRSLAEQWDVYNNPVPGLPRGAYPGDSPHGNGQAVDVTGWSNVDQKLFNQLLAEHGFIRDLPAEGWHLHHPSITAVKSGTTIEGDDVLPLFWKCASSNGEFIAGRTYMQDSPVAPFRPYGDPSTGTAMRDQHSSFDSPETPISGADLTRLAAIYGGPSLPKTSLPAPVKIDYTALAKALKAEGLFDLTITGTARPTGATK